LNCFFIYDPRIGSVCGLTSEVCFDFGSIPAVDIDLCWKFAIRDPTPELLGAPASPFADFIASDPIGAHASTSRNVLTQEKAPIARV
jgi:hypothetical protein